MEIARFLSCKSVNGALQQFSRTSGWMQAIYMWMIPLVWIHFDSLLILAPLLFIFFSHAVDGLASQDLFLWRCRNCSPPDFILGLCYGLLANCILADIDIHVRWVVTYCMHETYTYIFGRKYFRSTKHFPSPHLNNIGRRVLYFSEKNWEQLYSTHKAHRKISTLPFSTGILLNRYTVTKYFEWYITRYSLLWFTYT